MKKVTIVGVSLATVLVATIGFGESTVVAQPVLQKDLVSAQYLATSTLPIPVVGTVTAADKATIYAQVAGVVTTLPHREGSLVSIGVPLSIQSTPVTTAQIDLAQTQAGLTSAQQRSVMSASVDRVKTASVRAYSAEQVALLRVAQNDSHTMESIGILLTTTQAKIETMLSAMNYISNNRPLFTAGGLNLFEKALRDGYGTSPSYFSGRVMFGGRNSLSLKEQLAIIQTGESDSVVDVENAAILAISILETLEQVLLTAEREVFRRGDESTEITKLYLEQKTGVSGAVLALRAAQQSARQVIDATLEDSAVQEATVAVSKLDEVAAIAQRDFAIEIAKWSNAVAQAQAEVVVAEQSLGTVRAPFSGVVSRVLIEEGEYALPGTPLLEIVGDGVREITVTVPTSLGSALAVGQPFLVDGQIVGLVDRLSPVSAGRGQTAVIALSHFVAQLGESVRGEIETTPADVVYLVPRSYVHFDSDGAFILFQNRERSSVRILHDAVSALYISVTTVKDESLVPAVGVSL